MSSIPSIINRNEQAQAATTHYYESSTSSEEMLGCSSEASTSTPTLPGQILTENDHEDNLMELIDELIHNFLSRTTNRRSPYRTFFRWTVHDDERNLSYSVVVKINEPSPLI